LRLDHVDGRHRLNLLGEQTPSVSYRLLEFGTLSTAAGRNTS